MAGAAAAATLDDVKARGELNCGVSTGLAGFSAPDANGVWQGFDVAVCRAVAAAVLAERRRGLERQRGASVDQAVIASLEADETIGDDDISEVRRNVFAFDIANEIHAGFSGALF